MTIHTMEIRYAREICEWAYEEPFDIFNWPSWEKMQKDGIEFGDSVLREEQYAAVLGGSNELIGFAQFFPITGVTRLGLGLRPDLCSQGLGPAFIRTIFREAIRRAPWNEIDLEVLAWNTRAIRAYERAGFRITDTYSRGTPRGFAEFHCMVYDPETAEV
ncbi:GNAT family N-acetyltransferase [Paenibacillus harenae]|uniref:GNAT family N-acetyltransferase n=1 Tax=Paenibacillus harenae TaxID=306543 RepID=UPI00048FD78A|nr:GNAT family N-acetyltransferase [Paenibacillus harenae]